MKESIKIKLPNNKEEYDFKCGNPIVLLGANGSGKTRFSIEIENINDPSFRDWSAQENIMIHRISAQKSLSIQEKVTILDSESSRKNLFKGDTYQYSSKLSSRFGNNPATGLLDDFNKALSLLFAEEINELQREHKKNKKSIENSEELQVSTTIVEKATKIWNEILPHREIDLNGNNVYVNYGNKKYHGKEMSDGERVILYMICQVLVQRPKTLLIIDEPELHIHKSIVNKLWTLLEAERNDCIFLYITHDLDFAISRNDAKFIWIKNYDGERWDYEFLDIKEYEDIPEDLLFEILGTREKIIFVEGDINSYDKSLYSEIYRDKGYHVINSGGCQEVMRLVKSKAKYEKLSGLQICGIIDRDFRVEKEIESLKKHEIYCLNLAEVENIFIVPEVLDIMEKILYCDEGTAEKAKKLIEERFEQNKKNQINEAVIQELKHQISLIDFKQGDLSVDNIKEKVNKCCSEEKINKIFLEKERIFNSAKGVEEILKIFNFKQLIKDISKIFGLEKEGYPQKVLKVLRTDEIKRKEILEKIKKYVPDLP